MFYVSKSVAVKAHQQIMRDTPALREMNSTLLKEIIGIAVGGSIGSLLRFGLSSWVQERTKTEYFPWGDFYQLT